jgi:hypothetical protein
MNERKEEIGLVYQDLEDSNQLGRTREELWGVQDIETGD